MRRPLPVTTIDSNPADGRYIPFSPVTSSQTASVGYLDYAKPPDYLDQFRNLVRRWRAETFYMTTVREKINVQSFKDIVELKGDVVRWIFRELRSTPDFLFMALPLITKEDPVTDEIRGKPSEIIDAWLLWGDRNGYA